MKTGDMALGGGCSNSIQTSNSLIYSNPSGTSNNITGWQCGYTLATGNCMASAICGRLGP